MRTPVFIAMRAPFTPTTAGIPYSRATTAPWERVLPISGTRAVETGVVLILKVLLDCLLNCAKVMQNRQVYDKKIPPEGGLQNEIRIINNVDSGSCSFVFFMLKGKYKSHHDHQYG